MRCAPGLYPAIAPATTLPQLAALIARSRVFVGAILDC
jgi:ADP-heptose:LPS heptosyltransferase